MNKSSSTESVDIIEKIVFDHLKPLGFRKHGRTLHRFMEGDISQVINFQNGCPQKGVYDVLWINLGIRVPECFERKFVFTEPPRKYYHEYDCNMRMRLDELVDGKDNPYDLKKDPHEIGNDALARIIEYVLPIFDKLSSRDTILQHRSDDATPERWIPRLPLLEKAMIYGRRGDIQTATALFNAYYQTAWQKYLEEATRGYKRYLKKGERVTYFNRRTNQTETIVAEHNGYVRIFNASQGHLEYLKRLAKELNIALDEAFE